MLARNRFLLLVVVGGAALAIISLSLQFLNLIPIAAELQAADGGAGAALGKSRKRVFPVPRTEEPNPISEAYSYCNTPNRTEQAWEGHSPVDYKLLSVQVMIRHGDRYPLYYIPKTKRPAIDCTLSTSRKPSHPLLNAFIRHMGQGARGHWESPLGSVPRLPNHSACEMGELTQTGVVQHLRNGQLLHRAYKRHKLLPADWSPRQVWLETTGKSRTLQSGLAFLYGLLPDFDWARVTARHQWSTLFCGAACDCPARNRHLEEEQRRQYRLRVSDTELERTYADMARTLGLLTRQLRAANPIDSLLCHLCHGIAFPCVPGGGGGGGGGCLTMAQFAVIRRQQLDDEADRRRAGLYRKYAVLAMYPYLNRTAGKMERVAKDNEAGRQPRGEEVFSLSSAHDVTVAPLLSALGLEGARFPRFAARVVFELWKSPPGTRGPAAAAVAPPKKRAKARDGELFIRVLYNGEDVTFHTDFCRAHDRHARWPLCPLKNFLSFVRRDMFAVVNATSYQEACYRRPG
ncbi:2-phosphoxylose phosphatase 1 isoform X2 [Cyclopterus lumpus]|uniref:2-phosphoxylose phosphatase 1 n=1 Tax=Cyclopterus lumpus TaxID=8103 RepID=A0A8C2XKW8_CYCLU|nr:2-phosphoxylose phosphatase 1 isoform X2 [Cyclopterus lumpus]